MRITDADDDYTVTADQRAALMELESLTWNYPTPQQARGRASSLSHGAKDDTDDSDDDDDDESYYMDIVPYDMTERLKEVNRALIEDPTPAECDRAITIRFREVIADYHSPRDDFPSDSDDGYGDSSDILYDAEEEEEGEEGLTSLTAEVKEVLGGNVNVLDMAASSVQENDNHGLVSQTHSKTVDIPKLQLEDQHDDASSFVDGDLPEPEGSRYVLDEKSLLLLDERSASCSESSVRDVESPEIEENLPGDSRDSKLEEAEEVQEATDLIKKGSVSLVEVSEKTYLERGPRSLGDMTTVDEIPLISSVSLFSEDTCNDASDTTHFHLPAKSESDFASFDYSDDFEDFQEESGSTEKDNYKSERGEGPIAPSPNTECPPKTLPTPFTDPAPITKAVAPTEGFTPSRDSQKQSNKSKKDHVSRKGQSPPIERRRKPSSESAKTLPSETARSPKPKRVGGGTPMIKPALLSSDKLNTIKHNDSGRHKSRSTTSAPSASSSPLSSASSSSSHSSSSSSSASSYSVSRARSRNQSSISGPVRPTAHRSSGSTGKESSRVGGGSPVRPPSSAPHNGVSHTPSGKAPGGRLAPPARVRKAASASDLHNRVTDEADDRRRQNDEVFRAWLRQKNKQAAQNKKQQQRPAGKRTAAEVAERRAQAEEAFQVWLSRKRDQLRLEKKLRGERRRLEDQSRYARTKSECEVAYKEWCRRKRDEVRMTARSGGAVPRSQSLERTWVQEKTRKLYSAYLNNH